MKDIKVLGTGCANCKTTLKFIEAVATEQGVVIDGTVVHVGGVPPRDKIAGWLSGAAMEAKPGGSGCCSGGKCC